MTNYIETQTKDGATVRIEVEADHKGAAGFGRLTETTDVSNEAVKDAYDQTLNTIRACAAGMIDTLQALPEQPSTASIDFAIKVDAEAGAMVAKSMGDAQFKVSLSWRQEKPEDAKGDDS